MRVVVALAFLLALSPLSVTPCSAQGGAQSSNGPAVSPQGAREKANENLSMLLGGTLGGPYIQLAQDIARTVNDGDDLRVLPVAAAGAMKNVRDILLLRGVDLAITSVQVLNYLRASGTHGPNLDRRVAYITPLTVDMFHVLARPEINSLKDLNGKKVAFNPKGSATSVFGPSVLKGLGITVEEVNVPPGAAVKLLAAGNLDAAVCLCPMPVPAYAGIESKSGIKFLEVPYLKAFEESYLPASLPSAYYPNLVAAGSNVRTIATTTVLITYNWRPGTSRYRKVEKVVNALFSKFDKLRKPPHHPTWRDVNFAASIRGWQRFPAAQQWLDRQVEAAAKSLPTGIDLTQARRQATRAAPHDAAEQQRLFKEFLEWRRRRSKR